jgi:hypothetical protein
LFVQFSIFLFDLDQADLNELRSKTVVDVNLDPSHFFRNELAQAIRDIRNEFEALNDQQRADLHNRYMMSYNELILRHQKPDLDPIQTENQRIQEEKLRTTLLTTRNEVAHMKARNEELNNRIHELQLHINQEQDDGKCLPLMMFDTVTNTVRMSLMICLCFFIRQSNDSETCC